MQETHLKKVEKTEILATLKSFSVGESEFITFSDSQVDTITFRVRYSQLRKQGLLTGEFSFFDSQSPVGTLIFRKK